MKRVLVAVLAAAFVVGATPAAAPSAEAHTPPVVKKLKKKVRYWKNRALDAIDRRDYWRDQTDTWKRTATTAIGERNALKVQTDTLNNQVNTLNGQLAAVTSQRDQAFSGLPGAIAALPNEYEALWANVFRALRARSWPCDSYFASGGYWSVEFYAGDGTC